MVHGVDEFARARTAALDALTGDAASRIATYYDLGRNYAGGSFLAIGPNLPDEVTAADLFAVTLLNVDIGPRAARRVLSDKQLVVDLQAVPTDVRLEDADGTVLDLAGRFYEALRQLFLDPEAERSDPWVAPAKLAARKRPRLMPVRDGLVRRYLGIEKPYSYRRDWEIYQRFMRDEQIRRLLDDLPAHDPPLRVLDVALWTRARR